jgi:CheY-like chemotaxis protein
MSIPFSDERVACIRDDARHMSDRAGTHEDHLQALVRNADGLVRQAAALSAALARADIDTGAVQQLCSIQRASSAQSAEAVRRACVSAREQHVTARRLLTRLADECAEAEQTVARHRTAAVLVVDDAEEVRDLVALVLRDAGFVVRTATNGLEAIIAAYEMQPAVIVMDLAMPVLDGIEAARLIKATEGIREAKVIAYTGNASIPDGLVGGCFTGVVPKPSSPDVLLAAVQHAVSL